MSAAEYPCTLTARDLSALEHAAEHLARSGLITGATALWAIVLKARTNAGEYDYLALALATQKND